MTRRTLTPLLFAGLVGLAACGSSSSPAGNSPTTVADAMTETTTAMKDAAMTETTTAMKDTAMKDTATTAKP